MVSMVFVSMMLDSDCIYIYIYIIYISISFSSLGVIAADCERWIVVGVFLARVCFLMKEFLLVGVSSCCTDLFF